VSEYDRCSVEVFASLKLTPREAEVLFWISRGKSNHDIGVIFGAKSAKTGASDGDAASSLKTSRGHRSCPARI